MGRKSKYTIDQKVWGCEEYLSGRQSASEIAQRLNMGPNGFRRILEWSNKYRQYGCEGFAEKQHNRNYSKEFKEQVVNEYLRGNDSLEGLTIKYNIPSTETVRMWVKKYNSHIELKDYYPQPEVYMADRKKTTIEERKTIVEYCLEHDRDYTGTAALYGCSYSQVYDWVRKYTQKGEDGLVDKRGVHKTEEELTETEKLQRRIKELENQLRLKELENEILKKLEKLERK